jgi:hypothetical protein
MRRNQIAKLPEYTEFACGWFGVSFFHLCRVTELKSHANHFFLCFSQNSYGMAVNLIRSFTVRRFAAPHTTLSLKVDAGGPTGDEVTANTKASGHEVRAWAVTFVDQGPA